MVTKPPNPPVVPPGFPVRHGAAGDRVAVDEDFDGADVAGEVAGVAVGLREGLILA
jgi:hypothetical protein